MPRAPDRRRLLAAAALAVCGAAPRRRRPGRRAPPGRRHRRRGVARLRRRRPDRGLGRAARDRRAALRVARRARAASGRAGERGRDADLGRSGARRPEADRREALTRGRPDRSRLRLHADAQRLCGRARLARPCAARARPRRRRRLSRPRRISGRRFDAPARQPTSSALGAGRRAVPRIPGYDGTGVTIALLDTGIDATHPYLRGRVLEGIDIVDPEGRAAARPHPHDPALVERHGTQTAGLLVGSGGPAGLRGCGARLDPAADQGRGVAAERGGRLRGLRPYRPVARRPRAGGRSRRRREHARRGAGRARRGRGALRSLRRRSAGAGGRRALPGSTRSSSRRRATTATRGPTTAASPGREAHPPPSQSARSTRVGARRPTRMVVRAGLHVLLDQELPLAGAVAPEQELTLPLVRPAARSRAPASAPSRWGASSTRAATASSPGRPRSSSAPRRRPRPGAGLRSRARRPSSSTERCRPARSGWTSASTCRSSALPAAVAREARRLIARGAEVTVSLGAPGWSDNPDGRRVALFSSHGLAFGGGVKPEVTAPGVELVTADIGRNEDKSARYGTISGTSAAAALAAGTAAVLAQARPALDAHGAEGRPRRRSRSDRRRVRRRAGRGHDRRGRRRRRRGRGGTGDDRLRCGRPGRLAGDPARDDRERVARAARG